MTNEKSGSVEKKSGRKDRRAYYPYNRYILFSIYDDQVKVVEKTNEFRRFGGPIQLASNALSTIKAIDPGFFDRLMEHFTFTGIRTNGIKDGIRTEW